MIKYLLPKEGNFYKANLHCHTTCSDGELTPLEMKNLYKSKGYSILAITDHEVLIPHHKELSDGEFLVLNGFELGFDENWKRSFLNAKVCDLCIIALDPENITQPCFHRTKYHNPERNDSLVFDEKEPDFNREYNADCINEAIKICREKGIFVTHNHPHWSLEKYEQYSKYKGMHAMEIINYGSLIDGYNEKNGDIYDEQLLLGKKIFALGTDDNHNRRTPDSRMWDSFGAWTVIKSESLDYKAVTDAMLKGSFYASEGPEIYEMYLDGDQLHVECSGADKVFCTTAHRRCMSRYNEETGLITHAVFEIKPDDIYFRVAVYDKEGKEAYSNAYFTEDVLD